LACAERKRKRGVIRIDGGEVNQAAQREADAWAPDPNYYPGKQY
jgi:hypothetical protein